MKKTFMLAAIVVAATSTPVLANPFDGPYVGVQVGSDSGNLKADEVGGPNIINGVGVNGVEGGVFAGWDMPIGSSTFVGAEAQFSLSDAKASIDDAYYEGRADYSYGVSGRIGEKLSDKTALYARVGWRSTHLKVDADGMEVWSHQKDGLLLGGGIETYVTPHASIRLEYGYTMYGTVYDNGSVAARLSNQQVALGAAWHF